MDSIGDKLRETRERLGVTLDEVERATRIRVHHLKTLESGDLDALPSPVQARGFLHNYAEFLGLDADVVLMEYVEKLQSQRNQRRFPDQTLEPKTQPSVQLRSKRPRWFSTDLLVAAMITISILAIVVWGGSRVMDVIRANGQPTEEVASFLIPTITPSPEATVSPAQPLETVQDTVTATPTQLPPTAPIALGSSSVVNLQLVVEQRAFILVVVDGEEAYRDRANSGDHLEFQAEEVIEVVTGNGGGVRVYYNGQGLGLMGNLGQVVTRLFTLGGMLTPTPTQTGTPTPIPSSTPTPRVSPTPAGTFVP